MKAIRVRDDDANTLVWDEAPTPEFADDEVLVRVRATAVNRADLLQRAGRYPVPPGASDILGLEIAGEVAEVGDAVEGWAPGDRVAALLGGGGYAEYAAVPADMLLRLPDSMDFAQAAAIPEVFYTAFLNIYLEACCQPGERVLVHAAASGVGTAAIQLCRLFANPVFGTASEPKLDALRELGVDRAIGRHTEDFAAVIDEATDGAGVDVILDPVGADYLADNVRSLSKCGRLVLIGLLSGASAELNLGALLMKRLRVVGSVLRSRSSAEKRELTRHFRERVWPHFASGSLEPVVYRTMPITEANEAHALLRSNETVGKVVLEV